MDRAQLKVLCVEDDSDTAHVFQSALERAGHTVVMAADGPAGLDTLIAGQFDIAVVDLGLPFMNGFRLARDARDILGGETPPLVAVTGLGGPEHHAEAKAVGFAAYFVKPVALPELVRELETLVAKRRARATTA